MLFFGLIMKHNTNKINCDQWRRAETDEESVTLGMIPIYLFNASPWGSLTKGYRLLNPLSQREMREENPYNIQR